MWALNCRAGANLRHLGSVCWQPTALGGNHVGFKLQLANSESSRAGANLRHLGSVCWQPTALGGNHVGL